MKLGFNYGDYTDASFMLYILRQGKINAKFYDPNNNKKFEVEYKGDTYVFSPHYYDLDGCDKKFKLTSNDNALFVSDQYNKTIVTPGDVIRADYHDEDVRKFLDSGNMFLSFCNLSFEHTNFIFYPLFSLVFHYYHLGYKFLNYYQDSPKYNLLGIYHQPTHIGGTVYPRRNEIFNEVSSRLGSDFKRYETPHDDFDLLLDSYRYFGQWYNVHIAGYTDFKTSVCNLTFETYDSLGSYCNNNRFIITEKTAKSLLFSKENIFFIWYGHESFISHLRDYGFWFLNFEFYDPTDGEGKNTAILKSVYKTVDYLKQLKNQLKTNENVYKYLLEKYGEKLKNNGVLYDILIHNCQPGDNIINLIKNG